MKNLKTVYICQSCSGQVTNWAGQCPKCGEWNTLVETLDRSGGNKASGKKASNDGVSAGFTASVKVETLDKVKISDTQRILTGVGEFDRVLGGGFVPGQAVLLAGEPGIGKSTLITQVCKSLHTKSILYMCGEESPAQIKLRATRMGYAGDNLNALQETDVDVVEQVL